MQLVDQETFLKQLAELLDSTQERGTVWLTHKRLTHDGADAIMKSGEGSSSDEQEYPCLVRASDGKGVKFSCRLEPGQLAKFNVSYGALLKSSMTNLRKRDKKREKQRSEAAARRKKRLAEPVVIEGPKRGSGRKKRQRLIKAAMKQEEALQRIQRRADEKEKARIT